MATSIKVFNSVRPALFLASRTRLTYLLPRTFANSFHTHNLGGERNPAAPVWSEKRNEKPHSRPDYYRDLGKDSVVKEPSMMIYAGKMGPGSDDSKRGPGIDYGSSKVQDDALLRKRQTNEKMSDPSKGSNVTGVSGVSGSGSDANKTSTGSSSISGSTSGTSQSSHHRGSRSTKDHHQKSDMNQDNNNFSKKETSSESYSAAMRGPSEMNKTAQGDSISSSSSNQGGLGAAAGTMNRQTGASHDQRHNKQHSNKGTSHKRDQHIAMENDQTARPPSDMSDTVNRDPVHESGVKVAFAADGSSRKAAEDKAAAASSIDPTDTSFVQANPGNKKNPGTPHLSSASVSNEHDYARSLKSGCKDNSYKVGMGNSGEAKVRSRSRADGVSRPDDTVTKEMAKGSENSGVEPGRSTGVGSNENITTKEVKDHKD